MADYIDLPIQGSGSGDMLASVYDPDGGARQVAFKDELGGGGVVDGEVATFADLPSAATNNGKLYFVTTTTGVWLINRKTRGFYISDGVDWLSAPEVEGYAPLAGASFTGNISSTTLSGTGARLVEASAGGTMSATKTVVTGKLSDATAIALLINTSNWTGNTYTGTAIAATFEGQYYRNATYYFFAYSDNDWIRVTRS